MIYRVIICDKCGIEYREKIEGLGFPKWGHVRGFIVDGIERDLHFCPKCLTSLRSFLDAMRGGKDGMD